MTDEERYQKLANEKQAALEQSNKTYDDMLNQNTQYSQSVDQYLQNWQNTQNDIYDKQTAFQVELQNQNKEKAEKEYQKEAQASKNAYYDFINPYGVQAEIQAQNGLSKSGYSETVKSQAWTTQQNRTAQARAKMQDAKLQFDNAIKEAYLNNDTLKAETALKMLEQKQQEMLRSFNYTSDVAQQRLGNNQNLDSDYNNRYNTLYGQIQDEKARAEAIRQWEAEQAEAKRQFDEKMAYQKEQDKIAQQNWEREYALSQQKAYSSGSGGSRSSGGSGGSGGTLLENGGKQIIHTDWYTGEINEDAYNGTFSTKDKNGVQYQPNNVGGKPLHSSGFKVGDIVKGAKGAKGADLSGQTLWSTGDNWYVWDGSNNRYENVTGDVSRFLLANPSYVSKIK